MLIYTIKELFIVTSYQLRCKAHTTALSDIEVIHEDVQGAFYHFKYPYVMVKVLLKLQQQDRKTIFQVIQRLLLTLMTNDTKM
ncbi:hypothetical protein ACVNP0_11670 [Staphylococcus aureus]